MFDLHIEPILKKNDVDIYWVFGQSSQIFRKKLVEFWIKNKAIDSEAMAWRRAFEVACLAINKSGDIIGVASVYPDTLPGETSSLWFYRTFIEPKSIVTSVANGLLGSLFEETIQGLLKLSHEAGAPQGLAIVIENQKLNQEGKQKFFEDKGFQLARSAKFPNKAVWTLKFH